MVDLPANARVAKLVDAHGLGPCVRKDLWVRIPPLAQALAGGCARFRTVWGKTHGGSSPSIRTNG